MPTANELLAAIKEEITKIVHSFFQCHGCWGAVKISGRDFKFRMNETGAIDVNGDHQTRLRVYLEDDSGELSAISIHDRLYKEFCCFRLEVVEERETHVQATAHE